MLRGVWRKCVLPQPVPCTHKNQSPKHVPWCECTGHHWTCVSKTGSRIPCPCKPKSGLLGDAHSINPQFFLADLRTVGHQQVAEPVEHMAFAGRLSKNRSASMFSQSKL